MHRYFSTGFRLVISSGEAAASTHSVTLNIIIFLNELRPSCTRLFFPYRISQVDHLTRYMLESRFHEVWGTQPCDEIRPWGSSPQLCWGFSREQEGWNLESRRAPWSCRCVGVWPHHVRGNRRSNAVSCQAHACPHRWLEHVARRYSRASSSSCPSSSSASPRLRTHCRESAVT